VKYFLDAAEWFPVLGLCRERVLKDNDARDFTDDEIADLKRVCEEFKRWQTKLAERFGAHDPFVADCLVEESNAEER